MEYEYKIGATVETMQTLEALGITANPRPSFRPFSITVKDGNGKLKGHGFPVAEWHWDVMKVGEPDILAEFLNGGLSATVYIRTRLNRLSESYAYTWATYRCVMNWVTGDEDIQSRRNLGLTIEFTRMVLIPDEE
jgi:hypothetical protein